MIVANTGPALIYVKNRDPQKIAAIVRHLQAQPWAHGLHRGRATGRRRLDPLAGSQ